MPTRRPRHRRHRRHSKKFIADLARAATKWAAYGTPITVSVAGVDELDLAGTPDSTGPYRLVGAPPPEFRPFDRFWLRAGASDVCDVFTSLESMLGDPLAIAAWDMAPTWATLGTPIAISAVTSAADTFTSAAHGLTVGMGPYYLTASGGFPGNTAATTPYWIQAVPTANTFTLAASLGGAVIDLSSDGSGTITLVPVNVDLSLETVQLVAHGMQTGDGPVRVTAGGALPTGLAAATDHYIIRISADRVAFASSRANALLGTARNLTAIGSGTNTLVRALTVRKDFTADGIVEWLTQGVSFEAIQFGDVADVDTIFV